MTITKSKKVDHYLHYEYSPEDDETDWWVDHVPKCIEDPDSCPYEWSVLNVGIDAFDDIPGYGKWAILFWSEKYHGPEGIEYDSGIEILPKKRSIKCFFMGHEDRVEKGKTKRCIYCGS